MTKNLNYHGLKVQGLYSTHKNMIDYPRGFGASNLIFYNVETGEMWCEHVSVDNFINYTDPNIVKIYASPGKISKQKLLDYAHYSVLCGKVENWQRFIEKHNLGYDQIKDDSFLYELLKKVF